MPQSLNRTCGLRPVASPLRASALSPAEAGTTTRDLGGQGEVTDLSELSVKDDSVSPPLSPSPGSEHLQRLPLASPLTDEWVPSHPYILARGRLVKAW